jgi:predicted Zn-ribbon and HTH transcriptional regulator
LEIGEEFVVEDFGKYFEPYEQAFFRMVSCALQSGAPIKAIVEQLHKASEDILSLASAAARILKKYIKDGEIASGTCKNCGSSLVYEAGCVSCSTCGWSKGCG